MTINEHERRARQRRASHRSNLDDEDRLRQERAKKYRERQDKVRETVASNPNRVLTFKQWCAVNNFSVPTGRRIIARGDGPPLIRLSERALGIRESDNRAWQDSRIIEQS